MYRYNTIQCSDVAHKIGQLVIAAGVSKPERHLDVEIALYVVAGSEFELLEPRGESDLRNVVEQVGHLGVARQLPQHVAEALVDLVELRLVGVEIGRHPLLALEALA